MGHSERQNIGFVGVGNIGLLMVGRLIERRFSVVVCDIDPRRVSIALQQGADKADCPAEIANKANIIFTSLPSTAASRQVYFGDDGLLGSCRSDSLLIETSTTDPMLVQEIADFAKSKGGVCFVDAAVSGGKEAARAGQLSIMVGASPENFERSRGILSHLAKAITHCGGVGTGTAAKIVNNAMSHANFIIACEAAVLAQKAGLSKDTFLKIVSLGSGNSWIFSYAMERALAGDVDPDFAMTMELCCKDWRLAQGLARHYEIPIPALTVAHSPFEYANAKGMSQERWPTIFSTFYEPLLE